MAQGKVVDNLLLTLGLDFSGLDAGFLAADRTIKQNISAINSQKNQIKLQADMVVAIEDYAANLEVFQKRLVRAGTANPVLAHAVQGEVHLMNLQAAQLGKNFANALLPVAQELVPRITKVYAELTEFISDNKDTIKLWGQVAADVLTDLGDTASSVLGVVGDLVAKFDTVRSLIQKYLNFALTNTNKNI